MKMQKGLVINSSEVFMRHGVSGLCIFPVDSNGQSKYGVPYLEYIHTIPW